MSYRVHVDPEHRLAIIVHEGEWVPNDSVNSRLELAKATAYEPGMDILRDLRKASFKEVGESYLRSLVTDDETENWHKMIDELGGAPRVAWLFAPWAEAQAKLLADIFDAYDLPDAERRPFTESTAAFDWLGLPADYEVPAS